MLEPPSSADTWNWWQRSPSAPASPRCVSGGRHLGWGPKVFAAGKIEKKNIINCFLVEICWNPLVLSHGPDSSNITQPMLLLFQALQSCASPSLLLSKIPIFLGQKGLWLVSASHVCSALARAFPAPALIDIFPEIVSPLAAGPGKGQRSFSGCCLELSHKIDRYWVWDAISGYAICEI